jgi:general secretion pathway protein G
VNLTRLVTLVLSFVALLGAYRWFVARYSWYCGQTREEAAQIFVWHSLVFPMAQFRKDMGRYPSSEEGLRAMFERPALDAVRWKGPYLPEFPVRDPWGTSYQYAFPGRGGAPFDLWSLGSDPANAADDIGNW